MANKSVYQVFDTDALTHFGLDSAPIYGGTNYQWC